MSPPGEENRGEPWDWKNQEKSSGGDLISPWKERVWKKKGRVRGSVPKTARKKGPKKRKEIDRRKSRVSGCEVRIKRKRVGKGKKLIHEP